MLCILLQCLPITDCALPANVQLELIPPDPHPRPEPFLPNPTPSHHPHLQGVKGYVIVDAESKILRSTFDVRPKPSTVIGALKCIAWCPPHTTAGQRRLTPLPIRPSPPRAGRALAAVQQDDPCLGTDGAQHGERPRPAERPGVPADQVLQGGDHGCST